MRFALAASCGALLLLSCATATREEGLVSRAVEAMGGAQALQSIKTVNTTGTMRWWDPEQSDVPGGEPRFGAEGKVDMAADVTARASRVDYQKNFQYPAPRSFTYSEIVTPQAGYVIGVDSNGRNAESMKANPPAHSMSGYRLATTQRELLRASVGGLLSAMQANPKAVQPAPDMVIAGRTLPAVSYQGFIVGFDPQSGLPERVRTLDYDNIWGDVTYDYVYSRWRDVGALKVPMSGRYELNGRTVQEVQLSEVQFNRPIERSRLEIPAAVLANAAKPASGNVPYQWVLRRQFIGVYMDSDNVSYDTKSSPGLRLQELGPGVFHVTGGTHNSLLVEMSDHLIVVDTPVTDAQSMWVVNETRSRFPGKPIRWVVLTHHHMDHAGGVRGFLGEGAVLVVGQGAGAHFRRVLSAPMTRNPDMKPREFYNNPILEVPESHVMSDSRGRQVIVYVVENPHVKGMLMASVPDAKLGFVTDIWTPGPPLPAKPNPGLLSVVNAVKKHGIPVERVAGGHGSVAPFAQLAALAGQ